MGIFDCFREKSSDPSGMDARFIVDSIRKNQPLMIEAPFRHIIIDNAFPQKIYLDLEEKFQNTLDRGINLSWEKDSFSYLQIYDSFIWTPSPAQRPFSQIFFTPDWLDFINSFFPEVNRTNETGLTFHHRPAKSRNGLTWNGMAYGAFKNDPLRNGINAWYHQCRHAQDPESRTHQTDILYRVRCIAVFYFLNNKNWRHGDGGIELCVNEKAGSTPSYIAPLNNRLLIFPITPESFHYFRANITNEQNCLVQYLFEDPEDTFVRYDRTHLSSWDEIRRKSVNIRSSYQAHPNHSGIQKRENQKKVLLIGCTGKLGSAFVKKYANEYRIIGVARTRPAENLLYGFILADASLEWDFIIKTALNLYGSIDILINNAVSYQYRDLAEQTPHDFNVQLRTNLVSPFALSRNLFLNDWSKLSRKENIHKNHSIINIGSISGVKLRGNIQQGTYSVTKAALHMLTLHLASEWKKYGIRVNAIAFHGFKNHVSAETAVSTIKTCIENRGITEEIFIVSDKKTKIYPDWKYRIP